jgi:hypothetical protein
VPCYGPSTGSLPGCATRGKPGTVAWPLRGIPRWWRRHVALPRSPRSSAASESDGTGGTCWSGAERVAVRAPAGAPGQPHDRRGHVECHITQGRYPVAIPGIATGRPGPRRSAREGPGGRRRGRQSPCASRAGRRCRTPYSVTATTAHRARSLTTTARPVQLQELPGQPLNPGEVGRRSLGGAGRGVCVTSALGAARPGVPLRPQYRWQRNTPHSPTLPGARARACRGGASHGGH